MKLIKINAPVELNSGLEIASGSVLVISEGYAAIFNESEGFIPSQVATRLYASLDAFVAKKNYITDVKSFTTTFGGLKLAVTDFQTVPTEQLLINTVKNALELVFLPENLEVIDYTPVVEPEVVEPTEPTEPTTEETTEPTEPEVTVEP